MSKVLESLHKKKENSLCFECREKGTTFVNIQLGTFVCTKCAGLLRELNFPVKGLGVTIFKDKEVSIVEDMGNENAGKIWMAKFDDIKGIHPTTKDFHGFQEHLKEKYILKRFYVDRTEKESTKDNHSYKSCEVKKTHSAISTNNNSMNNSNIFPENDYKFDCQSETAKPTITTSKFKKLSSNVIASTLKIEEIDNNRKETTITSRKSENNIIWSSSTLHSTNTSRSFDFTRCNNTNNSVNNTNNSVYINNTNNNNINTTVQNIIPTNIQQVHHMPTIHPQVQNINPNIPSSFTHDFTKNVKMMDSLNNLYSGYNTEKKVIDPLDKLFYQYNFSSGNNMRVNTNTNIQHQVHIPHLTYYNNNSPLDCIYGINSQLKY